MWPLTQERAKVSGRGDITSSYSPPPKAFQRVWKGRLPVPLTPERCDLGEVPQPL